MSIEVDRDFAFCSCHQTTQITTDNKTLTFSFLLLLVKVIDKGYFEILISLYFSIVETFFDVVFIRNWICYSL